MEKSYKTIEIKVEPAETNLEFDDKHLTLLEELKKHKETIVKPNKLSSISIIPSTRKSKILFLFFPEWAIYLPPYNIARLSAVTKQAGYDTSVIDVNIEAYQLSRSWPSGIDFWHPSYSWKWQGDSYFTHIHPHLAPHLEKYFQYIADNNITVLGITLYYCNQKIAEWFVEEAKRRFPNLKVIAGGPMAHLSFWKSSPAFDFMVSGEGEENILKALDKIENNDVPDTLTWIVQDSTQRLDLDTLPFPDYSWCDFSKYQIPNGVCAEFSRGCTAKCTFCQETHFWKFRNRKSDRVVEEIELLYNNYGVNLVWFLDSLVNGNLKELEDFCDQIIVKNIKIKWTGYARCDKRMDLAFYEKLAKSGCFALHVGIESGSNKVLKDMDKGLSVEVMEDNLKYAKATEIKVHTNWILGFPTETIQDAYESYIFLVRNYKNMGSIAPGMGFGLSPESIVGQNFDRFNLIHAKWEGEPISKDFKNTKLHRLIRQKMFVLLMCYMDDHAGGYYKDFFHLHFYDNLVNTVEYETFNFDILNPEINPLANSFVNEIFAVARVLFKWKGAFDLKITFDSEKDSNNFGPRLGCNVNGFIQFNIDRQGNYVVNYDLDFKQSENSWQAHIFSHAQSTAAQRARLLANKRGFDQPQKTHDEVNSDIKNIWAENDFTFNYKHTFSSAFVC
jgi:radical SAM superfamily enzyme YgiQ (UPF0313 family)